MSNGVNKYERKPEAIIDLHGQTTAEAKVVLDNLIKNEEYKHVRIITGKGTFRETGPILKPFVQNYLKKLDINFSTAKLHNGGDGALEVFF